MKVNNVTKWIVIDHKASSLFSVIAGGGIRHKNVGKNKWLSLMDASHLGGYCEKEGFNLQLQGAYGAGVKVRIGIVADHSDNCDSYDSCAGFGTLISSCQDSSTSKAYDITSTSCGSSRVGCSKKPNKNKAAFGYILVQ